MSDEPATKWNVQTRFDKKQISSIEASAEDTENSELESIEVSGSIPSTDKPSLGPRAWFGWLVARYRCSREE